METKNSCPAPQIATRDEVPSAQKAADLNSSPFQPGYVLDGRFLITEVLSRSGMATILKAEDRQNQKSIVAIKVPHLEYESDPVFFSRFQREEKIGLELDHPYILKFIAVANKSRPYLVTEYLDGRTLEQRLKESPPLPEKEALTIASRICKALQYLHDNGVIHRDLKPQNVMLCRDGTLRIMDFGIARDSISRRITRVGNSNSMGTPDYMAPEQVNGKRADRRTDIYSLGAVLYEMLTGAVPFQDENPWAALNARVTGDPVAPRKLNPDLTAQAQEIVLRALQRNPGDRYPTAAAMKTELDDAEHVRVTGLADRLQASAPWKPSLLQRPAVLAVAMLAPLVVGIIVVVLLLFHDHGLKP